MIIINQILYPVIKNFSAIVNNIALIRMTRGLLTNTVKNLPAAASAVVARRTALWCRSFAALPLMVQHFTKLLRIDFIIVDNTWCRYDFCSVRFHRYCCIGCNIRNSLSSLTYAP